MTYIQRYYAGLLWRQTGRGLAYFLYTAGDVVIDDIMRICVEFVLDESMLRILTTNQTQSRLMQCQRDHITYISRFGIVQIGNRGFASTFHVKDINEAGLYNYVW